MNSHFLQSKSWETFLSEKENKKTFRVLENSPEETLAVLEKTPLGNYLFCPYGPTILKKSVLSALKSLAKANNCFFLRLEPLEKLSPKKIKNYHLLPSKHINPADTWLLDLTPKKETLLTNFSQGTRTRYNTFSKKGLSVRVSTDPKDIKYLNRLQSKLAKEKGINTFEGDYLKHELEMPFSSLYLVEYSPKASPSDPSSNNQPISPNNQSSSSNQPSPKPKIIAASLFFDDLENKTRFYMQSAADSDYKKLPATVALLSTSIFDAKEKGLNFFDFWGIAPANAGKNHPWAGFTAFKKSFGGFERNYAGTFDLPLNKPKYLLYKLLRRLNLLKRKILKA